VEFHPEFAAQYVRLCTDENLLEIAGEVTQLLDALEQFGHEIEGHDPDDPSHSIVISRLATFALRRTPPTPVQRIENTLVPDWERNHPNQRAIVRRTR